MGSMQVKYLLDTHIWIWWNMSPEKLSQKVKSLIVNPDKYDELLLSTISIWEFCKLLEKGRLVISCDTEEWIKEALSMFKLRVVELSPIISLKSTILPLPFNDDPADQIIVATGREEKATIITKDKRILDYPHIKAIW